MSDNIPFDIQMQIIKKVHDVRSLIRFRSVSKPWKSFIDGSEFIKGYGARHTQPRSLILKHRAHLLDVAQNFCFVDDDSETFKVLQQEFAPTLVVSPLLKQCCLKKVVGVCHGLLCLSCYNKDNAKMMLVIWNPCIGKSFGIDVPGYDHDTDFWTVFGFGVCPDTSDPTIVKVSWPVKPSTPWHVFTLSSGVWNVLPSSNLAHKSIGFLSYPQVVIDRCIYWGASSKVSNDDGELTTSYSVVSFDLSAKELKVVDLPDSLTNELLKSTSVSVSKLRGSLVVSGDIAEGRAPRGVWMMEHDSSFTKLFSVGIAFTKIVGFRKNGETIFETQGERFRTLYVYDPSTQQIKNLGTSEVDVDGSFFMDSYKQSLLLLDHSDSHIYSDDN